MFFKKWREERRQARILENRKKWLWELESGNYTQLIGSSGYSNYHRCAIGITENLTGVSMYNLGRKGARKFLGLDDQEYKEIMSMNDDLRMSFREIAAAKRKDWSM